MATNSGEATRSALIRSAEHLMARHGIDGADLNEIQTAAGQRNRSAIAYHFGNRAGLVAAITACHRAAINPERNRIVDRLEARDEITIDTLAAALVLPLSREVDSESGRDHLIVLAEVASRLGTSLLTSAEGQHIDSVVRVMEHLDRLIAGSRVARQRRAGQTVLVVPVLLADIARDVSRGRATVAQGRRRVPGVVSYVAGALRG